MSLEVLVFCKTLVVGPKSFGLGAKGSPFPWPSDRKRDAFRLGPLTIDLRRASDVDREALEEFEGVPEDFESCVTVSGRAAAFDACPWPLSGSDWASHVATAFRGVAFFEDGERLYDGTAESDGARERSLRRLRAGLWAASNPSDEVADLDGWLTRAATGDPAAADVLSQWSGWVRPRGAPGATRASSEPLGRALLRVCRSLARVDPCVASAFDTMRFVSLVHDTDAQKALRERLDRAVFDEMLRSLDEVDTRDREARALLERAKADGDFI